MIRHLETHILTLTSHEKTEVWRQIDSEASFMKSMRVSPHVSTGAFRDEHGGIEQEKLVAPWNIHRTVALTRKKKRSWMSDERNCIIGGHGTTRRVNSGPPPWPGDLNPLTKRNTSSGPASRRLKPFGCLCLKAERPVFESVRYAIRHELSSLLTC